VDARVARKSMITTFRSAWVLVIQKRLPTITNICLKKQYQEKTFTWLKTKQLNSAKLSVTRIKNVYHLSLELLTEVKKVVINLEIANQMVKLVRFLLVVLTIILIYTSKVNQPKPTNGRHVMPNTINLSLVKQASSKLMNQVKRHQLLKMLQ